MLVSTAEGDKFAYPGTRVVDAVAELAGVRFPDPYRWLEETSHEVRAWQAQQAELASSYVRAWPHWEAMRALVERYSSDRFPTVPKFAGGSWFREHRTEAASFPQVVVADAPYGDGRLVVDLAKFEARGGAPFLSWLSPSPNGRVLAIGVCTDGSEQNTIRLIHVDSGEELPVAPTQVLHDWWTGGVAWLPDSSGFYFYGLAGSVHDFEQRIFRHTLYGETQGEDIPGVTGEPEYSLVQISRDGRWAVCAHRMMNPIPIAVRDLTDPGSRWRPFVTNVQATLAGHVINERYVAITDLDAPRGRLVAIPLDAVDPNDPRSWIEIVPESKAVLRTVTPVGEHLYISEFEDTYTRVRVVDVNGNQVRVLPLPDRGAILELPFPIMMLPPRGHPDEFIFNFSTLTRSWTVFRHRPGDAEIEELRPPEATIDATIDDRLATAPDGTRIPYHVVRLPSLDMTQPQPTLLNAYGGYNVPWLPAYPAWGAATFVVSGGVFVYAHIRGGAELGKEWWDAGRMQNKQNCYADLFAVAEDLIANGITTSDRLAFTGASNGGLLSGNAVTQRPDLWKAVVPRVPVLDLIGACRDPYDRWAIQIEYVDPDDPEDVRRLATFSAYHLVRKGTHYPAVYVDAGETDPRCPPWHARKFAAHLQAAQAGEAPILLHVWENVGHGMATVKSIELDQNTEWLAFIFKSLGMTPEDGIQ